MPSLTLPDRLIWFAHCPKAGGTSVEQLMVEHWGDAVGHLHWGWDVWWRRGGWRTATPPNSPQHLIWSDARSVLPRTPDTVFALVRDPVARMRSEHRFQRVYRRGRLPGKLLGYLPFRYWLRLMIAVARRNPYAFDNHLRPQTDFVPHGANVFRLEDGMGALSNWLQQETGTALGPIPHSLKTGRPSETRLEDACRIGEFHASDYARFGYERPHGSPRPDFADAIARIVAPAIVALERRGRL